MSRARCKSEDIHVTWCFRPIPGSSAQVFRIKGAERVHVRDHFGAVASSALTDQGVAGIALVAVLQAARPVQNETAWNTLEAQMASRTAPPNCCWAHEIRRSERENNSLVTRFSQGAVAHSKVLFDVPEGGRLLEAVFIKDRKYK